MAARMGQLTIKIGSVLMVLLLLVIIGVDNRCLVNSLFRTPDNCLLWLCLFLYGVMNMLTFEALREQERKEKTIGQIQKMPEDFVAQLQEYLQRKVQKDDGSAEDRREIGNIRNTIARLIETREHKILDAVLYTSRTGLKPDNLTAKEQQMFDVILKEINEYRDEFLKMIEITPVPAGSSGNIFQSFSSSPIAAKGEIPADTELLKRDVKKYLVTRDVGKFVAPDLKEIELKQGDTLRENELKKSLNDLLLKRGIIEETK